MSARGPVAAIDLGTNSTRLLIVDARGRPLERRMRITRLGEGVDQSGRLSSAAMQRTLEVLGEFKKAMDERSVSLARATATSAARDAENADEFARHVTELLGTAPEILKGEEEARLTYLGATSELDPAAGPYLVIDVGGGSTELVSATPSGVSAVSLEMGCVRVTERFFAHDPPLAGEVAAARNYVRRLVTEALSSQPELSASWEAHRRRGHGERSYAPRSGPGLLRAESHPSRPVEPGRHRASVSGARLDGPR